MQWWVFVRHRRDHRHKPGTLHPGTIWLPLRTLLYNSSPAKLAQYDTAAPKAAPGTAVSRFEGYVDLLYNNYAARCLDFLHANTWNFIRLIIQHHGVWNHGRMILSNPHYICQNNCSWFRWWKSWSQFCIPSKKLTGNHTQMIRRRNTRSMMLGVLPFSKWRILPRIRTACFARISRGVQQLLLFIFHNNSLLG